jgi:hypothetical protein
MKPKKKSKFWNCAFVGALSVEFISEAVVRMGKKT